jgi:hypothetical protein
MGRFAKGVVTMRDASGSDMHDYDEHIERRDEEHDQVGTVEVQILLSWFFETSSPGEVAIDVPRAA